MVINVAILVLLGILALHGCCQGFLRGLTSLLTPLVGVWFALRRCDDLAMPLSGVFGDYTLAQVVGFLVILFCLWLGFRLLRRLLLRLVDWSRCGELDLFLGGCLGLARGAVLAWAILAVTLSAYPPSVRAIEQSNASVRLLAWGERAGGPAVEKGLVPGGAGNPFETVAGSLDLLRQLEDSRVPHEP